MGTIYMNATFTITAASAGKVSDGFLSDPKVEEPLAKLPFYLDDESIGVVYVRTEGGEPNFHEEEPLYTRSWTLQEMLLSTRALTFDAYQLTFTYLQDEWLPAVPTYITSERLCEWLPSAIFGVPDFQDIRRANDSAQSLAEWHNVLKDQICPSLIHKFSGRDLSVFEDRLPALAGIANAFWNYWGGTYVAGL
ncbi:hypothetical protein B0J14DRAFT_654601 [Halenospora varia]|nr:hypothetical protein B0J14DRAFT_654601 [Halenospora varia]